VDAAVIRIKVLEEGMTYRISYIDTSLAQAGQQTPAAEARTEDYASEAAALARARELLDRVDCHGVLVSDGVGEPVRGICLQLKLGFKGE
jgi:hypothetical protein